jgi:hypothetical protein
VEEGNAPGAPRPEGAPVSASEAVPPTPTSAPSPPPATAPPARPAAHRRFGLFRMEALLPFMIAAVSLIGAAVTWRASDTAANAGSLDAQVLRETTELQQIVSQLDAVVAHDRRIFAEYQEHMIAWHDLEDRAAAASGTDLASELRAQAQARLAMARTLRPMFRAVLPDFGDENGAVTYDEEYARTTLRAGDDRLSELDPEATLELANARHEQAVALVAVVILLVGSLFLMTVAQLGRGVIRVRFGGLGVLAAGVACVAFVLVEMGAR